MSSLTPIRVRGKRNARPEEKWNVGKRRKVMHESSPAALSDRSSNSSASRKRKARRAGLSRLEQLPTEILQLIFEFSSNVDLPFVSPVFSRQLKSGHLYNQLTTYTLHRVLCSSGRTGTAEDVRAANRLMNSKFFTWTFFRAWLDGEFTRLGLREALARDVGPESAQHMDARQRQEWTWYRLQPDPRLLPPKKVLVGPWDPHKLDFLSFIVSYFRGDPDDLDPVYKELAQEGVEQAVREGAGRALASFWTLGLQPDTELLRSAVFAREGCDQDVVKRLVTRVLHLSSDQVDVDFLDPALWSWAERAKAAGDEKGPWLMALLRDAAGDSGRSDKEINRAKWTAMGR